MTERTDQVVALLTSIDHRLAEQNRLFRRYLGPLVLPDEDLDGPKGDPIVMYDPDRIWKGESCKGLPFSSCPPEYLDVLAKSFDGSAWAKREKGDFKRAGYAEVDAARARGWARRLRDGWLPPAPTNDTSNPFTRRDPPIEPEEADEKW